MVTRSEGQSLPVPGCGASLSSSPSRAFTLPPGQASDGGDGTPVVHPAPEAGTSLDFEPEQRSKVMLAPS